MLPNPAPSGIMPPMDTPPTTFADVVFPAVIPDPLTYRVPAGLHWLALPGKRVLVPLGKRITTGYLVALKTTSPVARTTLPPGIDSLTRRVVRVTDAGRAALESLTTLSDADRALLALLAKRKVAD